MGTLGVSKTSTTVANMRTKRRGWVGLACFGLLCSVLIDCVCLIPSTKPRERDRAKQASQHANDFEKLLCLLFFAGWRESGSARAH